MNVLVVGLNFSPDLVGVGKYTGEMAVSLALAGHDVRVVTAPPYYPAWVRTAGWSRFGYRRECIDCGVTGKRLAGNAEGPAEIQVWRCPIYVPRRPSGLFRLLHLASFAISSLPVVLRQLLWRPRVVMVIAPALLSAPGALLAARLAGAAAWLHVQDFEVDAAYELGLLRSALSRRLIGACERWLLRRFDRVSTISPAMRERLEGKGVAHTRAVLLPNWVDTSAIRPTDEPSVFRAKLGIANGRVVALYSGTMGAKQGLEMIIEAARLLDQEPVEFVLCGDGPERARIEVLARGLAKVRFLPLQPASELNQLMNLADIHLLPQRPDVADLMMPSKLLAMLASGKPIVATVAAGTQLSIAVDGCGRTVAPGDAQGFAKAISDLAADPASRVALGATGRARAEIEFGHRRILGELDRQITALAGT